MVAELVNVTMLNPNRRTAVFQPVSPTLCVLCMLGTQSLITQIYENAIIRLNLKFKELLKLKQNCQNSYARQTPILRNMVW